MTMTAERNVLLRCFLAEKFTSPSGGPYPTQMDFALAERSGLIEWRGGFRLTYEGHKRLGRMTTKKAAAEYQKDKP